MRGHAFGLIRPSTGSHEPAWGNSAGLAAEVDSLGAGASCAGAPLVWSALHRSGLQVGRKELNFRQKKGPVNRPTL